MRINEVLNMKKILLLVLVILLFGCGGTQPNTQSTTTASPTTISQAASAPSSMASSVATTTETSIVTTHAAYDCTIASLQDIYLTCKDKTLIGTRVNKPGKLCSVLYGTTDSIESGYGIELEVTETDPGTAQGGVTACQKFASSIGTTACFMPGGENSGSAAIIAKGKYLIGISSYSHTTPPKWACTAEQTEKLVKLIQSR